MNPSNEEIEVEVVEVDGQAPRRAEQATRRAEQAPRSNFSGTVRWGNWQKQIRRPRGILWPLWIIPAVLLLFIVLALGLVIAVVLIVIQVIARLLRSLSR